MNTPSDSQQSQDFNQIQIMPMQTEPLLLEFISLADMPTNGSVLLRLEETKE
jgi:hypothetical protein